MVTPLNLDRGKIKYQVSLAGQILNDRILLISIINNWVLLLKTKRGLK